MSTISKINRKDKRNVLKKARKFLIEEIKKETENPEEWSDSVGVYDFNQKNIFLVFSEKSDYLEMSPETVFVLISELQKFLIEKYPTLVKKHLQNRLDSRKEKKH